MQTRSQSREAQQMAIQVVVAGDEVLRSAARYCNTSMATIRSWASSGQFTGNPELLESVIGIAKNGLKRALDEHDVL